MANPTKKVSLTQAIRNESVSEIEASVAAAVKIWPADCPAVPVVNTAYGSMKLDNAMIDDETRIEIATVAAADISVRAESLKDDKVKEQEIAKLISTNPVLRNIAASTSGGLL